MDYVPCRTARPLFHGVPLPSPLLPQTRPLPLQRPASSKTTTPRPLLPRVARPRSQLVFQHRPTEPRELRAGRHAPIAPRAWGNPQQEPTTVDENEDSDGTPPPGCSRVKLELNRPLGVVFEERKTGGIFVAEVVAGGRAERAGVVTVGDELIACSAVVYTGSESYGGVQVRKGMQVIRVPVRGESFNSIMAAIGTHPGHLKVSLELQKCPPETSTRG